MIKKYFDLAFLAGFELLFSCKEKDKGTKYEKRICHGQSGENKDKAVHVEWSINEKAAMEVAAGASYAGARCLVTMKMMGLNVASDALMSLAYVGVEGGLVVVSADDPGPISSQTEQDTRLFAKYCRIPVFDPSSVEEAYEMIQDAFEYSEKYKTPVLFRPTTRIDHAYGSITYDENAKPKDVPGFVKNSKRFVIFPRLSRMNHEMIEKRNPAIGDDFSEYKFNTVQGTNGNKKAVLAGGAGYAYAKEFIQDREDVTLIRVATPHPLPEKFLLGALEGVEEVLVVEELFPYLEEELLQLIGKKQLKIKVLGKHTLNSPLAGENTAEGVAAEIAKFLGDTIEESKAHTSDIPTPPMRPPVLCAGCPHRASFYAVKQAMKGRKANFSGDIGCYTLYGRRHHHGSGPSLDGYGDCKLRICRRLHILCVRHDGNCKCDLQRSGYDSLRAG